MDEENSRTPEFTQDSYVISGISKRYPVGYLLGELYGDADIFGILVQDMDHYSVDIHSNKTNLSLDGDNLGLFSPEAFETTAKNDELCSVFGDDIAYEANQVDFRVNKRIPLDTPSPYTFTLIAVSLDCPVETGTGGTPPIVVNFDLPPPRRPPM